MNAGNDNTDDATLTAAALKGDNAAFSELMGRHKDALYRFVRRYVGDADQAFDLVQDTFIACWSALDTYDRARPFNVWLRRIALNKCRDWSRRRQVRRFFFSAAPLEAADSSPLAAAPDDDALKQARLAALDAAIAALPAALKEPLLLTVYEGLSHIEAAAVLGLSARAVETRIHRAKQRLREVLCAEDEDD
ncbi:MAG: RNA polymerase subunit sigma-24 [Alphaproteobacteria bacterium]|nr:MAG: RNA polymerase subunit sigma-24 [Alphaproteobacteria bacterium]